MISEFFIKNKILLIMITLFLMTGGIFSFDKLKRNEDPGFKIRTASITTELEGLNAIKTDNYLTRPIENKLLDMEEIEDIRSESTPGLSVIYADLYEYYRDIQPVWDRLRRKTALADLPEGAKLVVNDEFADVFGALIGVSKRGASYEELFDTADLARDEFLKTKEGGKVEILGQQEETLYLNFKNSYFSNLKLTPSKLTAVISALNVIGGGGKIDNSKVEIQINSKNNIEGASGLKNKIIDISEGQIAAGDIFDIEKTVKTPVKTEVRSNGKNALILAVSMKKDGNILKWGGEIRKTAENLRKKFKGWDFEILALQSEYVKSLTEKFTSSLFQSIGAVILIVFFVLGAKTGLIAGFIILVDIASVFFAMRILNIGLDKISLSALIISLGILVDNSIVIAQAALRRPVGADFERNVIRVAGKFQTPLLVVTLVGALSFFPVFIAKSAVGEYSAPLFKVISIALLFSWFYSISLLPLLLIKFAGGENVKKFFLVDFLNNKIRLALNYPKTVVAAGIFIFLISLILFYFVPKVFFSNSDRNMFEIRLNFKNGTSFKETKNAVLRVEKYLKTKEGIENFSSYIGTSAPRYVLSASPEANRVNFAMVLANTKNYKTVEKEITEAKNFINFNLPDAQAVVRKIPLGPPVDAPVEIRIIDNNLEKLFEFAKPVAELLSKEKGVYLVKNNWGDFVLQYDIKVNENAALMAGAAPYTLFEYLNTLYNGKTLTYYYRGKNKIPVVLKGGGGNLENAAFYSPNFGITPLLQIAQIKENFTYSRILRRNNSYVLTIQGWILENTTADKICRKLKPALEKIDGLNFEFGGEVEKSAKGNNSVIEKIPLALLFILFILVWYFNSIKKPLMIIVCGILALSGANFGLFITGSNFGFITLLGYICLAGICMNNGIILTDELRGEKINAKEIKNAAFSRAEPVLLTCLTTIAGMLPLWIKNDPMFSTLAVSIIFGLLSSIFITLFFLPSLYILFSKD